MDPGPSKFVNSKDQVTSDRNELDDINASREPHKLEYDGSDLCLQDLNIKGTRKKQRTEEGNGVSDVAQEDLPPQKKRRTDERGSSTNTVPESAPNLDSSTYLLHKTWQDVAVTAAPTSVGSSSMNIVENEMRCSICSELFVKAVTLNCSHSFCDYCITEWKKNSSGCPICRKHISSVSPTLVLDNFIEKILETAPEDVKQHREEVIVEREGLIRLELLPNSGMMEDGSEEETDDGEGYDNDDEDDESHDEFDENGFASDDTDDQDDLYGNEDEEHYDDFPENDDEDEENQHDYYENGDGNHVLRCLTCGPDDEGSLLHPAYNYPNYNCVLQSYGGAEVFSTRRTLMDIIFNRRGDYFS